VQVSEPFFPEYEAAVESFLRNGGHTPSIIRSPRKLLDQFRAAFPHETGYLGARFELADSQDIVSVRGTTIAGHDYEWPEPPE
jgi:hypothetical protein